jgi:g-D-glutamyl-meso-diaminopimelate peptidase
MNLKKYYALMIVLSIIVPPGLLQAKVLQLKPIYTAGISEKTNHALEKINTTYDDITELITIGKSAKEGTAIKAIRLGKGDKNILINGAHHGREALTTILVLDQLDYLAEAYTNHEMINGYNARAILNTVSIWFVPLLNPDGADLAMSTLPSWKANGRGVDLNRNYPALYATIKLSKAPGAEGYPGAAPFSETETQALRDLCYDKDFEAAIAYHSAGQIIYWWYHQTGEIYAKSAELAGMLSQMTGYALVPPKSSAGGLGFTDWFIQKFDRPSFTVEIGKTVNQKPLKWSEYQEIWKKNKNIPLQLAVEMIRLNTYPWETTVNGQSIRGELLFGSAVVPVREVSQIMDLSYSYDIIAKTVTISKADQTLNLTLNEKEALHNNEQVILPVPAYQENGTSYVPLRTVLDLFSDRQEIPSL